MTKAVEKFLDEGRKTRLHISQGTFCVICANDTCAEIMRRIVEDTFKKVYRRFESLHKAWKEIDAGKSGSCACIAIDLDMKDGDCVGMDLLECVDRRHPEIVVIGVTSDIAEVEKIQEKHPRVCVVSQSESMYGLLESLHTDVAVV